MLPLPRSYTFLKHTDTLIKTDREKSKIALHSLADIAVMTEEKLEKRASMRACKCCNLHTVKVTFKVTFSDLSILERIELSLICFISTK